MKIKVVVHEAEEGGYWAEVYGFRILAKSQQLRLDLEEALVNYFIQIHPIIF